MTTPAGINPFTGDPNWQRIASYLIGPTANGITLDANGSLLVNVSSSSFGGTAPIRVNGTQISLSYLAPLALSGTALTVSYTSPITVSGGNLTVSTNAPIYINGTKLDINIQDPLYVSSGELAVRVTSPVFIDGGGAIAVDLSAYPPYTDSGEQTISGSDISWVDGTPPSSLANAHIRYIQIGNFVTVWVQLEYNSAGTGNIRVKVNNITGYIPSAAIWSSGFVSVVGNGAVSVDSDISINSIGCCNFHPDTDHVAISCDQSNPQNAKNAWATFSYHAA